ncbi:DUF11 domain-containing protein [Geodermatophilaceae bacterium NBWT11]|nr:DUF11 domain-containing protein [Geodermatophilaceae bacterium NBWT11]
MTTSMRRSGRRALQVLGLAALVTGAVLPLQSAAAAPAGVIASAGPLTQITTSPTLNCQVTRADDQQSEWFPTGGDGACGTFVAVDGAVFGPADLPAGGVLTGTPQYVVSTPVSQTAATGAGTETDPLTLVTVVGLGDTGLTVTQTDRYVVGAEAYRTDVVVANPGPGAVDAVVYRAGDCYLQDSDSGRGTVTGTAVACRAGAAADEPDRIEQLYPLTPGSSHLEGAYDDVWTAIATGLPFPDTCLCDEEIDNGVGLSWPVTVPSGGTARVAHYTTFSPLGASPLEVSQGLLTQDVVADGEGGFVITIRNTGAVPQTVTSIVDTLPAGFTYRSASTSGDLRGDPSVAGQDLTWLGSFVVPEADAGVPGVFTFRFSTVAPALVGDAGPNRVVVSGPGVTVVQAVDVPVTVVAGVAVPTPGVPVGVAAPNPAAAPAPAPQLAATGVSTAAGTGAGVLAVLLGSVCLLLGRRPAAR